MPSSEETLIKLAVIEQKLETNSQNWINPVRRIEEALQRVEKQITNDLVEVREDVKDTRREVSLLKEQMQTWKIRISTILAVVSVSWLLFGDRVRYVVDKVFQ